MIGGKIAPPIIAIPIAALALAAPIVVAARAVATPIIVPAAALAVAALAAIGLLAAAFAAALAAIGALRGFAASAEQVGIFARWRGLFARGALRGGRLRLLRLAAAPFAIAAAPAFAALRLGPRRLLALRARFAAALGRALPLAIAAAALAAAIPAAVSALLPAAIFTLGEGGFSRQGRHAQGGQRRDECSFHMLRSQVRPKAHPRSLELERAKLNPS